MGEPKPAPGAGDDTGRPPEAGSHRPGTEPGPAASLPIPPGAADENDGESRPLTESETLDLLRRNNWGVLATVGDGEPYAVPVIYGFDGRDFYVANRPGRKVDNMASNPAVCLTVAEVVDGGAHWASVVVLGRVEWVDDLRGRLHAFDALRRQHGDRPRRTVRDAARVARARIARIVPVEVTGRARNG